jgi:thiol-disulfide isomerase/thioredoxin
MWWHKLVREWTKIDYAGFSLYAWTLVFCVLAFTRFIQTGTLDLVFIGVFALAMIPVEFLIVVGFQKYSSNTKALAAYLPLSANDFDGEKLLRDEKCLIFFYSQWCPYCRKSFRHLKGLDASRVKVYRVDLSDENNPLWTALKIGVVPTLVAFKGGAEFWRANGVSMVGLMKADFDRAAVATAD